MVESDSNDAYNSLAKSGFVCNGVMRSVVPSTNPQSTNYIAVSLRHTQKTMLFITHRTILSNLCEEM